MNQNGKRPENNCSEATGALWSQDFLGSLSDSYSVDKIETLLSHVLKREVVSAREPDRQRPRPYWCCTGDVKSSADWLLLPGCQEQERIAQQ